MVYKNWGFLQVLRNREEGYASPLNYGGGEWEGVGRIVGEALQNLIGRLKSMYR